MWHRASREESLYVEHSIDCRGFTRLQQGNGDIINGTSAGCFPFQLSVMSMTVKDEIGTMAVDNFGKSRCPKKRKYFGRLPLHRSGYRRVMDHDNGFRCAKLRHRALEFESLLDRRLHELFNLRVTERREYATPETSHETLGACESDSLSLICGAIEHLKT